MPPATTPRAVAFSRPWLWRNLAICWLIVLGVDLVLSAGDSWRYDGWQYPVAVLRETVTTALYGCVLPFGGIVLWGYGLLVVVLADRFLWRNVLITRLLLFISPAAAVVGSDHPALAAFILLVAAAFALGFRLWPPEKPSPTAPDQSAPSI